MAVDSGGAAYVVGLTSSPDLPATPDAFQRAYVGGRTNQDNYDAFVLKLGAGAGVQYMTYYGGSGGDRADAIAVDAQGNAYGLFEPALTLALTLILVGCGSPVRVQAPAPARAQTPARPQPEGDAAFEAGQTQKLLGVALREFPPPQGPTGFDELPSNRPEFRFKVTRRPLTGSPPSPFYRERPRVQARGPDGSTYEAYLGHAVSAEADPEAALERRRQRYYAHHGYDYFPQDVLIGKREAGVSKPALVFPDVGSHTTAPHHLAVDGRGQVHLAVADVNMARDNDLNLYWAIGDPSSGRWLAAWLIDRRGFTSWSRPWTGARGEKVHLLWNWCDVSVNKRAPGMGVFHLEWGPGGFGRKTRVVPGVPEEWDAAIDERTGRLLIVFSNDDGVYVVTRAEDGSWTRAALLHPLLRRRYEVSAEAPGDGSFVIRTGSGETSEWVLRPL